MISPHELKNKAFTRAVRGYNTQEVDEHFDFILSEYTELYKANDELSRRISKLEGELESYSKDSEAIRTALLSAQKVSAKIIDDANAKKPHSVLMVMNGHYHRDFVRILDGILYFEINSSKKDQ